jgi:hypothetical protein
VTDPTGEQAIRDALTPYGWTLGPEFWDRYHSDPWVFNLTNAAARMWSRIQELENNYNPRLQESQERNEHLWRELEEVRSAARRYLACSWNDFGEAHAALSALIPKTEESSDAE